MGNLFRPKRHRNDLIIRKQKANKLRRLRMQVAQRKYELGRELFERRQARIINEATMIDKKSCYIKSETKKLKENLRRNAGKEIIESSCLNLLAKLKSLRSKCRSFNLELFKMERFLSIMRQTGDIALIEEAKSRLKVIEQTKDDVSHTLNLIKQNIPALKAILKQTQ